MLDGRSAVANALMQQGGGYPGGYAGDPLRSPIGPRVPVPAAGGIPQPSAGMGAAPSFEPPGLPSFGNGLPWQQTDPNRSPMGALPSPGLVGGATIAQPTIGMDQPSAAAPAPTPAAAPMGPRNQWSDTGMQFPATTGMGGG